MSTLAPLTLNYQFHDVSFFQRNANSLFTALVVSGLVLAALATLGHLGVISYYYSSGILISGCMGGAMIFAGGLGALIYNCKRKTSPATEAESTDGQPKVSEVTVESPLPSTSSSNSHESSWIENLTNTLIDKGVINIFEAGSHGILPLGIPSDIRKEFSEIPKVQGAQIAYTAGKDRYSNVLPYVDNAVSHPYVNASKLTHYPGTHLLAQGPLPTTLNDFWRMIWDSNIESIFVVSKPKEGIRPKFEKYWPCQGGVKQYGGIGVSCVEKTKRVGMIKRTLTLTLGEECRTIVQYHSKDWSDHQILPIQTLHELVLEMEKYTNILSHCSAGIGRSGTLVTAYLLKQLHDEAKNRGESCRIDLSKLVEFQRMAPHGRPGMVQFGQYAMLYQYLGFLNRSE